MADNTQQLAEQIALLLKQNQNLGDNELFRASLEKINQRLERIESQILGESSATRVQSPKTLHASQQKFSNIEEIADEIIANLQNEKACPYEPTGKPCDHCSMCNSLGF